MPNFPGNTHLSALKHLYLLPQTESLNLHAPYNERQSGNAIDEQKTKTISSESRSGYYKKISCFVKNASSTRSIVYTSIQHGVVISGWIQGRSRDWQTCFLSCNIISNTQSIMNTSN